MYMSHLNPVGSCAARENLQEFGHRTFLDVREVSEVSSKDAHTGLPAVATHMPTGTPNGVVAAAVMLNLVGRGAHRAGAPLPNADPSAQHRQTAACTGRRFVRRG